MKKFDDIGFENLPKYPIKSFNFKWLIPIIPSILVLLFVWIIKPGNSEINKEIKLLNKQNDSLRNANKMIFSKINEYENKLNDADEKITELKNIDANYQYIIRDINKKMTDLKSQYEKANSHSNNYTSADIQRYFADIR